MKLMTFNTFLLNVFFPVSFFACINTIFVLTSAERSIYVKALAALRVLTFRE